MTASPATYFPPVSSRPTVLTPSLKALTDRALAYLRCGLPVNLTGPAGTGKTTIALHLAQLLQRPSIFIEGDDQLTSTELVRGGTHLRHYRVVDNYIRSVVRTEDHFSEQWSENWLTTACQKGYTLIYDEFTRSRPEANNVLLSVLEERVLVSPGVKGQFHIMSVHPEFRVIFTSNPTEYVGVHRAPDALRDRMVSMVLEQPDADTKVAVLRAHSRLSEEDCRRIVRLTDALRSHREGSSYPGLRAAINLAKVLTHAKLPANFTDPAVIGFCEDLLTPATPLTHDAFMEVVSSIGPRSAGKERPHGGATPPS